MESTLEGKYNPKDFEQKIYNDWEEKGYFKPSMDKLKLLIYLDIFHNILHH